jgi:hypothetical protein
MKMNQKSNHNASAMTIPSGALVVWAKLYLDNEGGVQKWVWRDAARP